MLNFLIPCHILGAKKNRHAIPVHQTSLVYFSHVDTHLRCCWRNLKYKIESFLGESHGVNRNRQAFLQKIERRMNDRRKKIDWRCKRNCPTVRCVHRSVQHRTTKRQKNLKKKIADEAWINPTIASISLCYSLFNLMKTRLKWLNSIQQVFVTREQNGFMERSRMHRKMLVPSSCWKNLRIGDWWGSIRSLMLPIGQ